MQKTLKAAVAAALLTPPIAVAGVEQAEAATVFTDVPKSQTHYDNIMKLYHENVISGFPDGTFRPNERVTRGQAAKILAGVLGLIKPEDTYNGPNPNFNDVPVTNSYYKYIAVLAQAGIINGYPDGSFRAGQTLTRGQMAKIIYNGFNLDKFPDASLPFHDVDSNNQYYEQIKSLYALGVTVGKTETAYAIGERVTRGQLASFVMRARHVEDKAIDVKVQNIVGTRMMTNKGTFNIAPSLQGVLNADNVRALTGADIEIYASNNIVIGVKSIELNARGSEMSPMALDGGEELFQGDLIINSEYIEVRNMTIDGDMLVNGVNSGARRTAKAITFNNVNITGTTTIKDNYSGAAGMSTDASEEVEITVASADLGIVSIERENVTFVTDTALRYVTVGSGVSAFRLYGDIALLEARYRDLDINGTGTITTFNYRGDGIATINLRGRVGNVNVTSDKGRIAVGQYTLIEILAKLFDRELQDVLANIDEAEYNVDYVIDYGKESNGMQSLEDLIIYTTRTDRTFYEGEAIDPTEFVVQGVYADGTLKRQRITAANITGYKPGTPGAQTIKITVDGISKELNINVVAMSSLRIVTNPTKTMYRVGDVFSTAGIVAEGTYADGTVRREAITNAHASGYDLTRAGAQNVTIKVNNRTASYPIRVVAQNEPMIQQIAVKNAPTKVKYYQGEALSLSGLTVEGTYTDGTKRTETITAADVTGYDPMRAGKQTLTINKNGLTAEFTVDVVEMTDLVIKSLPTQKEYKVDERLNTNGLQVVAKFADGTERTVSLSEAKITGFDSSRPGGKNVRVTYNGRAVGFEVNVLNVTLISVSKLPDVLTYFPGEALNLEGLEIQAQYSDQTIQVFPGSYATASGFNPNLTGDQVITLTYDGHTTQFKVRVLPLLSLKVEQLPNKTTYREDEELDLTGLKVIGTYEGNRTREEQITKSMISGYDATAHGTEQTVTITINNIETTFIVNVAQSPLALDKLTIDSLPSRTSYRVGIPFSLEGLKLSGLYNDNTIKEISLSDPNLKISQVDTSKPGKQIVTIEYGEQKETFEIDVTEATLSNISATTTKMTYVKGEDFDPASLTVKANFSDGEETLTEGMYEVSGFDKTKVGDQTITVTYKDRWTTLTVRVLENDVRSFTVEPQTIYVPQGGIVDVTKLKLRVTLDNAANEQKVITGTKEDVTVSSFNNAQIGTYPITVSYKGKTAPATVRVVTAQTIVSVDKVELWWEKNGTHAKYPYNVVSKADADTHNMYFKVLQATDGAGNVITDEAKLSDIQINTVNFTKQGTTQADTTSAQVNASTGRLSISRAENLDVKFTYSVGGIQLANPYTYKLSTVTERQATTAELTSGTAIATTTSPGITPLARTITFDVLDQVGERFDLAMDKPYYTLTKDGATEGATTAVTSYSAGEGSVVTSLAEPGKYTLRLYKNANKTGELGSFPLEVKRITIPATADAFDYRVSFDTSKEALDVANYAWANGYGAAPTKTDELAMRVQAFVDGVEVAMPAGATVKLKSADGMTLSGNTVKAGASVKPATNAVIVTVGDKTVATSPDIKLINTLPKFDAFRVSENVDIFKYFTTETALMEQLRNGQPITDKATLTNLVGRALQDVWTLTDDRAASAIQAIDVVSTPTATSSDGSKKTTAVNVKIHKQFTATGEDTVVTVNGDYVEAWMSNAAAKMQKAEKTPASVLVDFNDLQVDEVPASTIGVKKETTTIRTTTAKVEPGVALPTPIVTTEIEEDAVLETLTFNEEDGYASRTELVGILTAELGDIFEISNTSMGVKFTVRDAASLQEVNTSETATEKVELKETTRYIIQVGEYKFPVSSTTQTIEAPFAHLLTPYKKPGQLKIDGTTFKYSSQAPAVSVEQYEGSPSFSSVAALAELINIKLKGKYKADVVNGQLKVSTTTLGAAASLHNIVTVNDLPVVQGEITDEATQYKTPWQPGLDESYVGNLTLTFSQAVELPLTESGDLAEPIIINYTVAGRTGKLQLTKDDIAVSGTTVTVKLDGLAQASDFSNANATVKINSITGLQAVKGYYEKNVKDIYKDVTITSPN